MEAPSTQSDFENDRRTVLGRTLYTICRLSNIKSNDLLTSQMVKNKLKYSVIPESKVWRVYMMTELLQLRKDSLSLPVFTSEEIKYLLDSVCES